MIHNPVAFIVFNRPEHTQQTFAVLRKNRPSKLFIIADGPRSNHPTDIENCEAVRAIVNNIDWPCEVHRNYADKNLGLKSRVSSGLNWVFERVETAIILEDDCLAHSDFFRFCDSLLERYVNDPKVAVITGNNFQNGQPRGSASYYFSKYSHCWGWATWRRSWQYYQGDLFFWPVLKNSDTWKKMVPDKIESNYWSRIFDNVYSNRINSSWAYPWLCCVWFNQGLTATPNVNLVSNIGFGENSTHTSSNESPWSQMSTNSMSAEIIHPYLIIQDITADEYTFNTHYGGNYQRFPRNLLLFSSRVSGFIRRRLNNFFQHLMKEHNK